MRLIYYLLGLLLILVLGAWYFIRSGEEGQNGPQPSQMTFFITSANPGRGGDLGGLEGADNYCQTLANTAGAGDKTWRAYLSTSATGTQNAVNAKDRIGQGPWRNYKGEIIANSLDELHSPNNNLNKETALSEKGEKISGRGDQPNWHDILTGSNPSGQLYVTSTDSTCGNWTRSASGSAMVGHHDRLGLRDDDASKSWNSSHLTQGCSLQELARTGSGGLLYCFAQ